MPPKGPVLRPGPCPIGKLPLVKGSQHPPQQPKLKAASMAQHTPVITRPPSWIQPLYAKDQLSQTGGYHLQPLRVYPQQSSFPNEIHNSQYRSHNNRSVPVDGRDSRSRSHIHPDMDQIYRARNNQSVPSDGGASRSIGHIYPDVDQVDIAHKNLFVPVDGEASRPGSCIRPNMRMHRARNNQSVPVGGEHSQRRRHIHSDTDQMHQPQTGVSYGDYVPLRPQLFPEVRARMKRDQEVLAATQQHNRDWDTPHHEQDKDASRIDPRLRQQAVTDSSTRKPTTRPGKATNRHTLAFGSPSDKEGEDSTLGDILGQDPTNGNERTSPKRKAQNATQSSSRATKKSRQQHREDPANAQQTSVPNNSCEAAPAAGSGAVTKSKNGSREKSIARFLDPEMDKQIEQAHGGCNMLKIQELVMKSLGVMVMDDKETWDQLQSCMGGN
jgi:hypothetical protein